MNILLPRSAEGPAAARREPPSAAAGSAAALHNGGGGCPTVNGFNGSSNGVNGISSSDEDMDVN